uniref:Apolipoprotein L n=1 Tax=Astyanax mexicanus TaxID=7994 RepID=W5LH51_ASTMX
MQSPPPAPLRQEQVHRSTPNRNATLTSRERAPSTYRSRDPLEEQLRNYTLDTISDFKTVKNFVAKEEHWNYRRTLELRLMSHSKSDPITKNKKQLQKNLESRMWETNAGLKQLQIFLDAVERLAVTSPFIFHNESCLLEGVDAKALQSVIVMARIVCPVLIVFKRDTQAFFQPNLDNIEVLCQQLAKYIDCTEELCRKMNNPSPRFHLDTTGARQITSDHLRELSKIRKDESFRLMYLFGVEHANMFIDVYNECESEMDQFLSDLEKAAAKLDSLKTGSRISNITGCTAGVLGGALTIAGLALAPVTLGTSMALTFAGVGLGVASGATGISTGVAKMVVRKKQGKKANYVFQHFMEDVEKVLNCLHQIAGSLPPHINEGNLLFGTGKVVARAASVGNGIRKLVGAKKAVGAVAGNSAIYRALPKAAGVMGLAVNFLFIGLDLVTVIRESAKLAKGKKSKEAQLIYSRTALWRSEKNGWDKIYFLLTKEKVTFQSKLELLEQPVYH